MTTRERRATIGAELDDFDGLTSRYQRELLAHCYRMSGSVHEAEDLVQETFLRAWKASATFQGRSSVRTWLYRIATNVCLTNLEGKPRRPLPAGLGTSDQMAGDALEENHEIAWLEPVPDAAVVVAERDTLRLAFIAALQHLPARQRAVLILRDVLRWSAAETAEALDTTAAAVNSALQRAHAQLGERALDRGHRRRGPRRPPAGAARPLPRRLLGKDIDTIVGLLKADATWDMPPFTNWYKGADHHRRADRHQVPRRRQGHADDPRRSPTGSRRSVSTCARPTGHFEPFHLQVLHLEGDKVRHVTAFFETRLFATFGLPEPAAGRLRAGRADRLTRPHS